MFYRGVVRILAGLARFVPTPCSSYVFALSSSAIAENTIPRESAPSFLVAAIPAWDRRKAALGLRLPAPSLEYG